MTVQSRVPEPRACCVTTLAEVPGLSTLTFTLSARPPFRLDLTVWALRRRPDNAVDRWDGGVYRRTLVLHGRPLEIAVSQTALSDRALLRVTATGAGLGPRAEPELRSTLCRLLGLWVDLSPFYELAATDVRLSALAERFRGLKPPRFPTLFEALVNAIACQQITLTFGIRVLNRLTERYGLALSTEQGRARAFPRPCDLAEANPEALRDVGLSHQKARAIVELAQAITLKRLDPDELASLDNPTAVRRLCELRGVGRWTAEYALLRGLGRLEVFPGDDVGARNNLRRWLGLPDSLDYASVHEAVAHWQSYAGLVYLHLLVDRLAAAGQVIP
jgi:DNA-3-methyladenine glycosylase II